VSDGVGVTDQQEVPMKNRVIRTFAIAVAITSVAAAAAPAAVVEKGRFVDEQYGFSYDCGFPVEVTGIASGNFRLRQGTGDDATAFFSLDRISYREIHTNPQTGAWFSVSGHFANNEVSATRVEGSLFTFEIIKAGPVAVIEDSSGNLVSKDRGVVRSTILFDTGGDQNPGGEFVDLIDLRLAGPHPTFDRRCDVASELIG
jgi:hypothetical protein